MIDYISGTDHYNAVLARVADVRRSLWIGTADIKDLHVKVGDATKPFLAVMAQLIRRGAARRVIEPSSGLSRRKSARFSRISGKRR